MAGSNTQETNGRKRKLDCDAATANGAQRNGHGPASRKKKQLVLNAFVESCSGHQSPGLWQHPDDESSKFNDIESWVELAQLCEKAKIHGIFIADVLGGYDVYRASLVPAITSGAQWPVNEPLVSCHLLSEDPD